MQRQFSASVNAGRVSSPSVRLPPQQLRQPRRQTQSVRYGTRSLACPPAPPARRYSSQREARRWHAEGKGPLPEHSLVSLKDKQVIQKRSPAGQPSSTASPAWELALALTVNCLWIAAAVGGVTKLLPVRVEQANRLERAESKVAVLQHRVSLLQQEVERGLDASQAEAEIAARLYHIPPERMQVQLIPDTPLAVPPEESTKPTPPLLLPSDVDASHIAKVTIESHEHSEDSATERAIQPERKSWPQRWQQVLRDRR